MAVADVETERLTLIGLDRAALRAMLAGDGSHGRLTWPAWWPDPIDRLHVARWLGSASGRPTPSPWGPRAMALTPEDEGQTALVGHIGCHGAPRPIEDALADPTYQGEVDPSAAGAVEVGYTVLAPYRGVGYATEALAGLIDWLIGEPGVSTVLATVAIDNAPSLRVLDRIGGFVAIGRCTDDDGAEERVFRLDLPPPA